MSYKSTLLFTWNGLPTSGLDPLAIKTVKIVDFPVPAVDHPHLSTDLEGLALNFLDERRVWPVYLSAV